MRRMKAGMYAVIGRVKIKPGHEQETLAMIEKGGVAMVSGFPGSRGGYWARAVMVKTSSSTRSGCSMAKRVLALQRRHIRCCARCRMRLPSTRLRAPAC